jgi:hypothetical protein
MADQIRRIEYFYVEVPDKPGEGVRVLGALKEAGVNLLSFTAFPTGSGKAQIDLVPQDAQALQNAVKNTGYQLSASKQAFFVQGENRVGAAADVLRKLSSAGINVRAANGAAAPGGFGLIVWVTPNDYAKAAQVLGV